MGESEGVKREIIERMLDLKMQIRGSRSHNQNQGGGRGQGSTKRDVCLFYASLLISRFIQKNSAFAILTFHFSLPFSSLRRMRSFKAPFSLKISMSFSPPTKCVYVRKGLSRNSLGNTSSSMKLIVSRT